MRDDDRESFFLSRAKVVLVAHESCIGGANHVRGGVLKPHLLLTVTVYIHTQHAVSPIVLTPSVLTHQDTDAHFATAQENDSRLLLHTVIKFHHFHVFSFFLFLIFSFFLL